MNRAYYTLETALFRLLGSFGAFVKKIGKGEKCLLGDRKCP